MRLRNLVFMSLAMTTLLVLSPTSAFGAAHGTDRPLQGSSTGTAVVNTATGTGTVVGTFRFAHLGTGTSQTDLTGFISAGNTFSFGGTATFVAANGDKVFTTIAGTGTTTSPGSAVTTVDTITGGTGRFAGASGTFTVTTVGVAVSTVGSIVTQSVTGTVQGQISY
jgi:hypothetical protein